MKIAIFMYGLTGGGASRRTVTLANAFSQRGHEVELILVEPAGPALKDLSGRIKITPLTLSAATRFLVKNTSKKTRITLAKWSLARKLKGTPPDILLSAANHAHITALSAVKLSGTGVPIVLRVSNHITASLRKSKRLSKRLRFIQVKKLYPKAHGIIAVCREVAKDLINNIKIPPERVDVVFNPTYTPELEKKAAKPVDHPWLNTAKTETRLILSAGRLCKQKDYPTLLRAFEIASQKRRLRLIILGDGPDKPRLKKMIRNLGIEDRVDLPGFVDNPISWMARSDIFCLSSIYEGLPGVLIEALAVGCPVVATAAPGCSSEVLDQGRFGILTPVGEPQALAKGILRALDTRWDSEKLKKRASCFSVEQAVEGYLTTMNRIVNTTKSRSVDNN